VKSVGEVQKDNFKRLRVRCGVLYLALGLATSYAHQPLDKTPYNDANTHFISR
jgi:hypothetical protein